MAKRSLSPSSSLLLPFPDEAAEGGVNRRAASGFYMPCALDKGEMQNVHNGYMSTHAFAIGTQDALALRDGARILLISRVTARKQLRTLADLLAEIATSPAWTKYQSMLRTTASHVMDMLGQPADRIPVDQLPAIVNRFKDHLRARHHTRNAVRSYVYYLRLLIRAAAELGAKSVRPEIPLSWQAIYDTVKACKCGKVVIYAVENGLEPNAFGDKELEAWAGTATAAGRSYSRTRVVGHLFRKAIFEAGLNTLLPNLSRRRRTTYGIPVRHFPPALRAEVDDGCPGQRLASAR